MPAEGADTALLIIDMINCFDFEGAERLEKKARRVADVVQNLKAQARAGDAPVIYVNDNFGEWHSERSRLIERAITGPSDIAASIRPERDDFFIIKPQFSGFYSTNLPVLLPKLGIRRLVLTGVATDICILFTAADAHMRDYALWVPADAVAAEDDESGNFALATMRGSMGAETVATRDLSLAAWAAS